MTNSNLFKNEKKNAGITSKSIRKIGRYKENRSSNNVSNTSDVPLLQVCVKLQKSQLISFESKVNIKY